MLTYLTPLFKDLKESSEDGHITYEQVDQLMLQYQNRIRFYFNPMYKLAVKEADSQSKEDIEKKFEEIINLICDKSCEIND